MSEGIDAAMFTWCLVMARPSRAVRLESKRNRRRSSNIRAASADRKQIGKRKLLVGHRMDGGGSGDASQGRPSERKPPQQCTLQVQVLSSLRKHPYELRMLSSKPE